MVPLLGLLFLVVPIVELVVIVQVGQEIGVLNTIGLLIVVGVVGAALVRRQGVGVLRRVQSSLARGEVPAREVVDGFLILFAGALLLTPGFLSDVLAVALLVPPARAVVRAVILRSAARRGGFVRVLGARPGGAGWPGAGGGRRDRVVDVDEVGEHRGADDERPGGRPGSVGPGGR